MAPLPIKFLPDAKSKLDDAELLKKLRNEKKKSTLSADNILDIIEKIRQDIAEHLEHKKHLFEVVTDPARLEEYVAKANSFGKLAIDTETTGLNPLVVDIIGFSMYFPGEKAIYVFQIVFVVVVFVGCVSAIDVVWELADLFNGLMAVPNLLALIFLSPTIIKLTNDFFADPKTVRPKNKSFVSFLQMRK